MSDQPTVLLITAAFLLTPDTDLNADLTLLARAITEAGHRVEIRAWDDPTVTWTDARLAVIRSPWDYPTRLTEFRDWVGRCGDLGVSLANPASMILWNLDKRYLLDLDAAGVAVVPTTYAAPGDGYALPATGEFVVKPAIGAGSRLAARYGADDHERVRAHLALLHAEGLTGMIQPYLSAIDVTGERALVFIDGEFAHAMRKGGVLSLRAGVDEERHPHPGLAPWQPSDAELDLARRALGAVPGGEPPLYARVDLVVDPDTGPVLMELELIEPNLFLLDNPGSVATMARAVARRCASR